MTEYYNINFTINPGNEDVDSKRIYETIKNNIDNYKMVYKNTPHIYVGEDIVDFLLYNNNFKLISKRLTAPYIGLLYDSYLYINKDLQKGDFYLSIKTINSINSNQFKRKLKIEQINNSNEDNKI